MSEAAGEMQQSKPRSLGGWIAFVFGAAGLVGAMATDGVAVIGRHIHVPLLGSVEIAQVFVVFIGAAALIAATLGREHANVRVLTDRLPAPARGVLTRIARFAAALFFAVLAFGSAWIMWELRNGAEQSELLAIPIMALRVLWLGCALFCMIVFLAQAFSRDKAP